MRRRIGKLTEEQREGSINGADGGLATAETSEEVRCPTGIFTLDAMSELSHVHRYRIDKERTI